MVDVLTLLNIEKQDHRRIQEYQEGQLKELTTRLEHMKLQLNERLVGKSAEIEKMSWALEAMVSLHIFIVTTISIRCVCISSLLLTLTIHIYVYHASLA